MYQLSLNKFLLVFDSNFKPSSYYDTMNISLPISFDTQILVTWIIFGIIIGAIVHFLDHEKVRGGILGSIVIAILGSIAGGLIGNTVNTQSFLVALVGAIVLAALSRVILRHPEHIKTKVTKLD